MTFENITVNYPIIMWRSLIGSAYNDSLLNISFKNIVVNGQVVTEQNKTDFFELEDNHIQNITYE